nr:MAG TPA: hypothetical protein [Caudoviricetes sp.]
MDKETALTILLSLIDNNKLIIKPDKSNITIDEYNKYVVDTVSEAYKRLINNQ